MADLNKVMLIGRLKTAPVITSNGGAWLTVVTTRSVSADDPDGKPYWAKQELEHVVIAPGQLGAKCLEHLTAGRLVYVEGVLVDAHVHATDVHFLRGGTDV